MRFNPEAPAFICSDLNEKKEASNEVSRTDSGILQHDSVSHDQDR
jgi:hypothetical protein